MFDHVRVADASGVPGIVTLYKAICAHQPEDQYGAKWTWGEYPSEAVLANFVRSSRFVIGEQTGRIVAAGLATALVRSAIKETHSVGFADLHLDVLSGNLPALKLYQRCGFTTVTRLTLHYTMTTWVTGWRR